MTDLLSSYPVIYDEEGVPSSANFITDYSNNSDIYDRATVFNYGNRIFEDDYSDNIYDDWNDVNKANILIHLNQWAHLYWSMSLKYNPLYNVDGVEVQTFSDVETVTELGEGVITNEYGKDTTETTTGARSNQSTTSDNTYELGALNNNNKVEQSSEEAVDSTERSAHTDKVTTDAKEDSTTVKEHTITNKRSGNIGVTMSQQLLQAEWNWRQNDFFKMVFETLVREAGCYYE